MTGWKPFVTSPSQSRLDYGIYKSELGIMYRLNHNQDIVDLLLKLKELRAEYPVKLLSTRRSLFVRLVSRYVVGLIQS